MISPALLADLPAAARLMAESTLLRRYAVSYDSALASLSSALSSGDLILARREADLQGFAWVSFGPRILNGAAYLRLLLVGAPGQGDGTRLLLAVEEAARRVSNHLYLLATADNVGARRFYERHGYRHVGDLPGLVMPDLDESLYHKALRPPGDRLSG